MSAVAAEISPYVRFMVMVAAMGVQRPEGASWAAYERLKADFVRAVPDASQEQYESAMRAIARATGC